MSKFTLFSWTFISFIFIIGILQQPLRIQNIVTAQPDNIAPYNFGIYQNSTFGILLQYPMNWLKEDFEDGVGFVAPPENKTDRYVETVDIIVSPVSNSSLDSMVNQTIDNYKDSLNDFQLINSTSIIVGGNPAQLILYSYSDATIGSAKAMDVITTNGSNIYNILYITKPGDFLDHIESIQNLIESFQIRE